MPAERVIKTKVDTPLLFQPLPEDEEITDSPVIIYSDDANNQNTNEEYNNNDNANDTNEEIESEYRKINELEKVIDCICFISTWKWLNSKYQSLTQSIISSTLLLFTAIMLSFLLSALYQDVERISNIAVSPTCDLNNKSNISNSEDNSSGHDYYNDFLYDYMHIRIKDKNNVDNNNNNNNNDDEIERCIYPVFYALPKSKKCEENYTPVFYDEVFPYCKQGNSNQFICLLSTRYHRYYDAPSVHRNEYRDYYSSNKQHYSYTNGISAKDQLTCVDYNIVEKSINQILYDGTVHYSLLYLLYSIIVITFAFDIFSFVIIVTSSFPSCPSHRVLNALFQVIIITLTLTIFAVYFSYFLENQIVDYIKTVEGEKNFIAQPPLDESLNFVQKMFSLLLPRTVSVMWISIYWIVALFFTVIQVVCFGITIQFPIKELLLDLFSIDN